MNRKTSTTELIGRVCSALVINQNSLFASFKATEALRNKMNQDLDDPLGILEYLEEVRLMHLKDEEDIEIPSARNVQVISTYLFLVYRQKGITTDLIKLMRRCSSLIEYFSKLNTASKAKNGGQPRVKQASGTIDISTGPNQPNIKKPPDGVVISRTFERATPHRQGVVR